MNEIQSYATVKSAQQLNTMTKRQMLRNMSETAFSFLTVPVCVMIKKILI